MELTDLQKRALAINNPAVEHDEIYTLMDELGIAYKKTRCIRCLHDYLNIILEELHLIANAAEESDFNSTKKYIYLRNRQVSWLKDGKSYIIGQNTPTNIIEEFIKTHKGFYKEIK